MVTLICFLSFISRSKPPMKRSQRLLNVPSSSKIRSSRMSLFVAGRRDSNSFFVHLLAFQFKLLSPWTGPMAAGAINSLLYERGKWLPEIQNPVCLLSRYERRCAELESQLANSNQVQDGTQGIAGHKSLSASNEVSSCEGFYHI